MSDAPDDEERTWQAVGVLLDVVLKQLDELKKKLELLRRTLRNN